MSAAMRQDTLAFGQCEWDAEAADGVNLTTGEAWWGVRIKYRRVGTRPWRRVTLIDAHSWETQKIHAAINAHIRLNGTLR